VAAENEPFSLTLTADTKKAHNTELLYDNKKSCIASAPQLAHSEQTIVSFTADYIIEVREITLLFMLPSRHYK